MPQSSLNTAQKPLAIMPAPDCPAVALSTTSTSRPCSRAVLAAKHPAVLPPITSRSQAMLVRFIAASSCFSLG